MRLNEAKCRVLPRVTAIPCSIAMTGAERLEASQLKRAWGCWPTSDWTRGRVCPGGQKGHWHPALDQHWCGRQVWGSDLSPCTQHW